MAIVQESVSSYPTAYSTTGSINGTKYKNAIGKGADTAAVSGNDYSNSGSSSTATIIYSFEFDIPEDADIVSVAGQVKGHLENTSRSTANLQLYSGSTAKGSVSKFTSTSAQTITLSPGTWTRSEIDDMTLHFTIGYYGGLVNGATITVTYSYNDVTYIITVDNSSSAAVSANPTEVKPGHSSTIKADTITGLTITDNGTDVTSQFVERTDPAESYEVENVGDYGFDLNSSTGYYVSNNKGISKTAAVCKVNFTVPVSATVTFTFINYAEQGYDFGVFGNIDVPLSTSYYAAGSSGATITDSSYKLACNTSTYNTNSTHALAYDMAAGEHTIYVKYSKDDASDSNSDTLQFKVDITLKESYTQTPYYAYDIVNIQGNHTIVVVAASQNAMFFKISDSVYKQVIPYKKVNNSWVLKTDITTVFDSGTKYKPN